MKKTLTAVAAVALLAGNASAGLLTTFDHIGNLNKTGDNSRTTSLTVAAGDVVVMVAGTNKKASVVTVEFTTTAADVFTDVDAATQGGSDPNPNVYLSYLTITTPGTYDFTGTASIPDNITANLGIYQITATSGAIAFLDTAASEWSNIAAAGGHTATDALSWAGSGTYGEIEILGAASSLRGNITNAAITSDYENNATNPKRRFGSTTLAAGATSFDDVWDIVNASADQNESGSSVSIAFTEVIPEPTTLSLVAVLGGAALLFRRRRTI